MEPLLSRALSTSAPTLSRQLRPKPPSPWICSTCRVAVSKRAFTTTHRLSVKEKKPFETLTLSDKSYSQPAHETSQNVTDVEQNHFDRIEQDSKAQQTQAPWMREGSDKPPVARMRSAGAMTKGKLLTTPSRMLKLILPLTTRDANDDRKDVEPLALLVHPQQPLSYLERLIQSEIPYLEVEGREKIPRVFFRAQDATEEDVMSGTPAVEEMEGKGASEGEKIENADETRIDGKTERTGKISKGEGEEKGEEMPVQGDRLAEPSSGEANHDDFVRWSPSTEIGDFIRDAARSKEFAVDIEGTPSIYVGVPSFNDRTYYLRMRLRKTSRRILELADIKRECDNLAQRGAQRVAQGGFCALLGWWGLVYYLTFQTNYGWDVMEPVTYLVGLSGLIGGYMWFLYHNREVSYRSAMNFTVSRRQSQLYEQKGFNLTQWEGLVEEGNRLRREIKMVADEYDVEWDETRDEYDEKVAQALREERKKKGAKKEEDGDKDDEDEKEDK